MNYDNLKKYFDQFIYKYGPYRDDPIHKAIIDFLIDNVFNDSYNIIPQKFIELFENQNPTSDSIDQILLSIGMPKDILNKTTITDKQILFNVFGDFTKYKSTLKFVENIGDSFVNNFIAYELYLDYRDPIGGSDYKWYFIPKLLYNPRSNIDTTIINEKAILFDDVLQKTTNFFITKEQLTNLRSSNQLVLPLKTNIISLDFFISYHNTSALNSLATSIILKHFEAFNFTLFFISSSEQKEYNITILDMYIILYYLFMKLYNSVYNIKPILNVPWFDPDNSIGINLADLNSIFDEHDNIYTTNDVQEFFKNNIEPYFLTISPQFSRVDIESLEIILKSNLTMSTIIDFIEDEINKTTDNGNLLLTALINDVFYSIETFKVIELNSVDTWESDWFDFFVELLPTLNVGSPTDLTSYNFLFNSKPFHTEFISSIDTTVISSSKFNTTVPKSESTFLFTENTNSTQLIPDYYEVGCLNEGDPNNDVS